MMRNKKSICYAILFIWILSSVITLIPSTVKADHPILPNGMEKVCENDQFVLYLDMETTLFSVLEKESGRLLFSTPEDYKDDSIANKRFKDIMSSNILVTYVNDGGEKTICSAGNAVEFGQFEITILEDGFQIEYFISENIIDELAIPLVMPYSYIHERLLPRLTVDEGYELLQNYVILSVKDDIIKNYVKRHRIKMYPFIVEEDIYVFIPTRRSALNREIIKGLLEKAEVTPDEIIALNSKYYDHTSVEKNPYFHLTLEVSIDGYGLNAKVDMSKIEYDSFNAELKSITLLPYFGAAGPDAQGYILLPDGSGSLMRFGEGKEAFTPITLPVYGGHETGTNTETPPGRQPVSLGAFGIAYDNTGFAAVIRDGDAVSVIEAGLGGVSTGYNYVCTQFTYNDYYMLVNPMNLIKNPRTGKNPYQGAASVLYMFLDTTQVDYSGIAQRVRRYFEDTGMLSDMTADTVAPLSLDIVGAVPVTKKFMGITYKSYEALTSFRETEEIINKLHQMGVDSINVRLLGWTKGGFLQRYPTNFKPNKNLGGKKDFQKLIKTANHLNINLYPDISMTKIHTNIVTALFNGIFDLKGSPKAIYRYNHVTQGADGNYPGYYLLRPIKWSDFLGNATKKIESTGLNNISLSDFGYNLYSDHRKNSQNRQDSLTMAENEMNLLHHKDVKIMGQYGNGRLINKFDIITDIPLENSGFIAARESIPFLQMVVSGYVDYYGIPVNKSDNSRMAVLRSMEYGASGIKYLLTATDNTSAWQLKWNEYRNTLFTRYIDEILDYYNIYYEFSKLTAQSVMIGHQEIAPNVYMTIYDNGIRTYVNYNEEEVTVDGVRIDGFDFSIKEG